MVQTAALGVADGRDVERPAYVVRVAGAPVVRGRETRDEENGSGDRGDYEALLGSEHGGDATPAQPAITRARAERLRPSP
jgi:hypothetical protein